MQYRSRIGGGLRGEGIVSWAKSDKSAERVIVDRQKKAEAKKKQTQSKKILQTNLEKTEFYPFHGEQVGLRSGKGDSYMKCGLLAGRERGERMPR